MEEALNALVKKMVTVAGTKCIGDYLLKEGGKFRWKDMYFTADDVEKLSGQRGKDIMIITFKKGRRLSK